MTRPRWPRPSARTSSTTRLPPEHRRDRAVSPTTCLSTPAPFLSSAGPSTRYSPRATPPWCTARPAGGTPVTSSALRRPAAALPTGRFTSSASSAGRVPSPGRSPGAVPPERERYRRGNEQAAAGREPGGHVDVLTDDREGGGQLGQRRGELVGILRAVERAAGGPGDLHERAIVGVERVAVPAGL